MATYSTDLTTLTTAESGTWTEFASPYNGAGTPASDGENYIQGTDCRSQTTGKANGLEISCVFDNGSNVTITAGDAVFAWVFYAVGVNLETYANSGWRYGIGSSVSAWEWWKIGGRDFGRNPYGGWMNVAIDPTATSTAIGGGNSGNYRYFGSVPYTVNEISKGTPSAQDAIRHGRGEISATGTGVTFSEMAEYNDYNGGSTPPGTSSTSVDSGRHRLGLFQDAGGTYLWKGLMSVGTTASSVTWTDANETILVDDSPNTYAAFNKIEVNNASSTVTWTNITFTSLCSVSPGDFELVADADVTLTACNFNNLGVFVLDAATHFHGCTWNGCGQITPNGADIEGCSVLDPTTAADTGTIQETRTISTTTTLTEYDDMTIRMGANQHHAFDFGTGVTGDITLRNIEFSGFDDTSGEDQNGAALRFLATSGSLTCNLIGCTVDGVGASATNFFKDDAAGVAVTLAFDSITLSVTVLSAVDDTAITTAHVQLLKDSDKSVLLSGAVNGSGVISTSIGYDTVTDVIGWAREHNISGTDYTPQDFSGQYTANGFAIVIRLQPVE